MSTALNVIAVSGTVWDGWEAFGLLVAASLLASAAVSFWRRSSRAKSPCDTVDRERGEA
jgi:hypothetical protein